MTDKTFDLLDALNREGFDNSLMGFCDDCPSTRELFGSLENLKLSGKFVYLYREPNFDTDVFAYEHEPNFCLHVGEMKDDGVTFIVQSVLLIYYLD